MLTDPGTRDWTVATTAQGKGAQTRRAILDAAIARFGRDGYRPTSVADIARDAGVGRTVAFAYFPNKEALFLAAVDEDAAGAIQEGLAGAIVDNAVADWGETLLVTLIGALERHPLARRLLAGLEPEVTGRVLEIPALAELRKACAERLRAEQLDGNRPPGHRSRGHGQRCDRRRAFAAHVGRPARHGRGRDLRARRAPAVPGGPRVAAGSALAPNP